MTLLNKAETLQQLSILGHTPEDVYLTAFFPSGDPRTKGKTADKGRKATKLDFAEIEKWQGEGRGIYLVVNGYGHKKEEIKLCRAIFYEHDKLDKKIQLNLWQTLALPEPTLQIDTGGKSIHSYWVFEEPITPALWSKKDNFGQWKGIQADLLEFADADRALTNPNRIMRLAGAWYCTHDDEKGTHAVAQSKIVGGCEKRYTYEELRAAIPVQEYKSEPLPTTNKAALNLYNTQPKASKNNNKSLGLDFRTISHAIPTWNENGRVGYATFQCPVHTSSSANHSDNHIHVDISTGKWKAWCECSRKEIYRIVRERYAPYEKFVDPELGKQITKKEYEELKKLEQKKDSATVAQSTKENISDVIGISKSTEAEAVTIRSTQSTIAEKQQEITEPQQLSDELAKYKAKVEKVQQELNSLTYKPNIELNVEFLPLNLYEQLPLSGIVAVKARKGSGKSSGILKPLIKNLKAQKKRIISITPRLVLGGEQCEKFDIAWVDEFSEEKLAVGVCWDSLHKLMYIDWDVVIIDEVRAGLKHLVTANTAIKYNRPWILNCFSTLINKVTKKDGLVLMCDADLTDVEIDYVKALAHKNTPVFTVLNHHKGEQRQIEFRQGKRGTVEQQIINDIKAQIEEGAFINQENAKPIAIVADSQAELKAIEKQLYNQIPELREGHDWENLTEAEKEKVIATSSKTIRIDKETTETEFGKNFVRKPDEVIQRYKPIAVLYSPTMAFGVSIEQYHFVQIYGLYFGVIEPCEFRQQLMRYRPNVPLSIWAIDKNENYSGCKSPLPDVIKSTVHKNIKDSGENDILEFAIKIARNECDGSLESFQKVLNGIINNNEWDNNHINLWVNIQARINAFKPKCAEQLKYELEEIENADVLFLGKGNDSEFGESIKGQKIEDKVEIANHMCQGAASNMTVEEARESLRTPGTTWEERLMAEGVLMKDFLPGVELTADFIYEHKIKDSQWLTNQYLYWLLINPDAAKALDAKKWHRNCTSWSIYNTIFLPDLSLKAAKIKLLQDLGIINLVDTEQEFSEKDENVKNLMQSAFKYKDRIRRLFNLSISEEKTSPIKFIGKLLEKIGLNKKQSRSDGKTRYYVITGINCTDRIAVLAAWDDKYNGVGLNDATLEAFSRKTEPNEQIELTDSTCVLKENWEVSVNETQTETKEVQLTDNTYLLKESGEVSVNPQETENTQLTDTTFLLKESGEVSVEQEKAENPQNNVFYTIEFKDTDSEYVCDFVEYLDRIYKFMIVEEPYEGYEPEYLTLAVDDKGEFMDNVEVNKWEYSY